MSESPLRVEYEPELGGQGGGTDRRGRSTPRPMRSKKARALRAGALLVATMAALILPFVLLVRLSVYLYSAQGLGSWTSLAVSAFVVFDLLLFYVLLVRLRFQRKLGVPKIVRRALAVVVASYLLYALVYLSGANAKTPEIRSAYVALHPLLRVATGTVLIADREAMVTDVGRTREDYVAWGLPVNEASLHFEQDDGYVHAVDLRTVGRPEWRNRSLEGYYRVMGFRTLRHVGTADHLHVSMPTR